MSTVFSRFPCLRQSILAALVLSMFPLSFSMGRSHAAGLAEEHNILYYLVEMQRRFKKNCGGAAMPEAPSLNPSAALRGLAEQSAFSDRSPADFAGDNGLAGIPLLAVRVRADSPQEAFDRMNATQCRNLMKSDYRYIGAARSGDQWTVFLAGAESGAFPGAPGVPAAPETLSNTGVGFEPSPPVAPIQPPAPAGSAAISPSVTTRDAGGGFSREVREPHPSVPTPMGGSSFIAPHEGPSSSSASEQSYRPEPVSGEPAPSAPIYVPRGGAGPVDDPRAPAAPVVVQEFIIDPTGKVIGPFPAGMGPSGETADPGRGVPLPYAPSPASR